ncbi:MAG: hypothetical protein JWO38_1326 [Gemmataceae bacterium]|nr:hypothetical protein [Gemmataceae bacterium]
MLPGVGNFPPVVNRFRQFQTAFVLTPNQYMRTAALSVRITRTISVLTSRLDPPCVLSWFTRGHGIGASVQAVTRHQARR